MESRIENCWMPSLPGGTSRSPTALPAPLVPVPANAEGIALPTAARPATPAAVPRKFSAAAEIVLIGHRDFSSVVPAAHVRSVARGGPHRPGEGALPARHPAPDGVRVDGTATVTRITVERGGTLIRHDGPGRACVEKYQTFVNLDKVQRSARDGRHSTRAGRVDCAGETSRTGCQAGRCFVQHPEKVAMKFDETSSLPGVHGLGSWPAPVARVTGTALRGGSREASVCAIRRTPTRRRCSGCCGTTARSAGPSSARRSTSPGRSSPSSSTG